MPEMNGFEVCRRLKSDPQTASIPVIFLSGVLEREQKIKAFEVGGVDYITKPFVAEELLARVRIHLELRALQKSLEAHVARRTQELQTSEAQFRDLANSIDDIFFALDADFQYTYWNQACGRVFRMDPEQMIGTSYFDFEPNQGYEWIADIYKEVMKTGESQTFETNFQIGQQTIYYEINAYPAENGCSVLIKDITERKLAEEALQQKDYIIESASSAIATADLNGSMTYGNPAFLEMWGFKNHDEFIGKPFSEYWLVADRLDEIMNALMNEDHWSDEIQAQRSDGTIFDVQVSAALVRNRAGNPYGLMSSSVDITERKNSETLLILVSAKADKKVSPMV